MSVPIYHPAAIVSHEVLEEEAEIIRAEGWFHVNQIYFANAFDADKARRAEAERRIADRERSTRRICAWCHEEIRNGQFTKEVALKKVHVACAKEFETWIYDSEQSAQTQSIRGVSSKVPVPPAPLEQQLRKSIELGRIQDDDLVTWGQWVDEDTPNERYEYEQVRWAELSVYERHTVERQSDGRLVGGYPF